MAFAVCAPAVAPAAVLVGVRHDFTSFGGDQLGVVSPKGQTFGRHSSTVQHGLEGAATERVDRFQSLCIYGHLTVAFILFVKQIRQPTGGASIEVPPDRHIETALVFLYRHLKFAFHLSPPLESLWPHRTSSALDMQGCGFNYFLHRRTGRAVMMPSGE